ncbi:hypothetical protein LH128_16678 [Sphingomonas sp. LH128]|nr:hypothetical protein LH128_16678 [Sphingomonas sp. LH128]
MACNAAQQGRIHDRKIRARQSLSKSLARWGWSIHVILLEHESADEADDGCVVGKDADDIGSSLDLFVDALERVGRRDLRPVLLGERHIGEHLFARAVHHDGELLVSFTQGIGDVVPLFVGGFGALLGEDRLEHGYDSGTLFGTDMCQSIAHPVHATALLGCMEDLACGAAQAFVIVGDDELDAAQAAIG